MSPRKAPEPKAVSNSSGEKKPLSVVSGDLKGLPPHAQLNAIAKIVTHKGVEVKKHPDGMADFSLSGTVFLRLNIISAQAWIFMICHTESFHDPGGFTRRSGDKAFEREILVDDCPRLDIMSYFVNVAFSEAEQRTKNRAELNFDPALEYGRLFRQAWLDGRLTGEERLGLEKFASAAWFLTPEKASVEYRRLLFDLIHQVVSTEFPLLEWEDEKEGARTYFASNTGSPAAEVVTADKTSISFAAHDDTRHLFMAASENCKADASRKGWVCLDLMKLDDLELLKKLVFLAVFRAANGNRPLPGMYTGTE